RWQRRTEPGARALRYVAPGVADGVLPVSLFAAPRPGLFAAARRCTVVHSPFDTGAPPADRSGARTALLAELGCGPDTRVVGFFGNLMARKRPLVFVDAIAEMRAQAPDLPRAAPVCGDDREALSDVMPAQARARGIADCIRLMGFRRP